jgi:hypothetical protein
MKIFLAFARHIGSLLERALLLIAVTAVVGAVLLWYFGVYDTAKGKCDRGDPGACAVWTMQQSDPGPVQRILQNIGNSV